MPRHNDWQTASGYEDHRPTLRLTARNGEPMSEKDCIVLASILLNHVRTLQGFREQQAKERKQHLADIAFEEAEARRLHPAGSHRKV